MGTPKGALEELVNKQAAMGKIATPEDIAAFVAFLASEDAKAITGQCVRALRRLVKLQP